jgi:hypothetical protein
MPDTTGCTRNPGIPGGIVAFPREPSPRKLTDRWKEKPHRSHLFNPLSAHLARILCRNSLHRMRYRCQFARRVSKIGCAQVIWLQQVVEMCGKRASTPEISSEPLERLLRRPDCRRQVSPISLKKPQLIVIPEFLPPSPRVGEGWGGGWAPAHATEPSPLRGLDPPPWPSPTRGEGIRTLDSATTDLSFNSIAGKPASGPNRTSALNRFLRCFGR